MFDLLGGSEPLLVPLTLYTDSFVIKGHIRTRQARITDMLNHADEDFLVLADVVIDEYGSRNIASRAEFAQVNLGAVLFAVAATSIEPRPDLRTPKVPEQAMISIPPFQVIGRIHLLPERDLREGLSELTGQFIPVTEATYWSDTVGEARQTAPMVAVNHHRAQILAPHRDVDPWAGLDRSAGAGESAGGGTGEPDPWGGGTGEPDPWGSAGGASAGPADPAWPEVDRPPG